MTSARGAEHLAALKALRVATEEAHGRLERALPLAARDLSRPKYVKVVRAFYGFWTPLEAALDPWARAIDGLCWDERRRARLLHADLLALGLSASEVDRTPICHALPPLRRTADALGALYVVEGSTLGGRVVSRLVGDRLGIDAAAGCAFFSGYGPATGEMWQRFVTCLAADGADALARARTVEAAVATFDSLERWLTDQGALR